MIQCDRPGMRLEIDLGRLTPAQRADAATELRKALGSLEAPAAMARPRRPAAARHAGFPPCRRAGGGCGGLGRGLAA
jgi:adenylate cyclase